MKKFVVVLLITLSLSVLLSAQTKLTPQKTLDDLGFKKDGFPIVAKPVTISVFMGTHALLGNKEELDTINLWIKNYEKMTGVHLDLQVVLNLWGSPSPWVDQMNLAMASGSYPEIFWKARFTKVEEMRFGKDGVLLDLAPLVDAGFMPNLSKLMQEHPEMRNAISTPDGKIYSLGGVNFNPVHRVQTNTIVNRIWLKELGLNQPKTIDELYNVLVAFKNNDPNRNGEPDEWPVVFAGTEDVISWIRHFGYLMGENGMFLDQQAKEIIHVPSTEDYKDFLKFMQKLYAEGLMHPDSFTLNGDQRRAIGSGKVPLIGMAQTNSPGLVASGLSQVAKSDDLALTENRRGENDYVFMEPIVGPRNGRQLIFGSYPYSSGNFAITNKCKYPEVAARWVDYFFTDEGGAFLWAGIEGEAYKLPGGQRGYAGGEIQWLNADGSLATQDTFNDIRKVHTMQPGGAIPGLTPSLIENLDYKLHSIKEPVSKWASYPLPSFYFAADTLKAVSTYSADIGPYIQQFTANAITGKLDIEKEWPNYLSTLKKMGLEKLLVIYQDAYKATL